MENIDYNGIFNSQVVKFIFRALLKKNDNIIVVNKAFLKYNGFKMTIDDLKDEMYFRTCCLNSDYCDVVYNKNQSIKLRLTALGKTVASSLEYDKDIILYTNTLSVIVNAVILILFLALAGIIGIIFYAAYIYIIPILIVLVFVSIILGLAYKNIRDKLRYIITIILFFIAIWKFFGDDIIKYLDVQDNKLKHKEQSKAKPSQL